MSGLDVPFLSFVIAGLDPAIHLAAASKVGCRAEPFQYVDTEPGRPVDCRVKPGNDG